LRSGSRNTYRRTALNAYHPDFLMPSPTLSVVIPVYNEEAGLPFLFGRLYPALDALRTPYEIIFVNDGSSDSSAAGLREQFERRPDVTRVVLFNANYGQHLAIMAGFRYARGRRIVTLDADLQNPPEEIGKLLAKMDEGYDYVGGVRAERQDTWFRRNASRLMNRLREKTTHIHMTDQGCMLRAYGRQVVDAINKCEEVSTFIPALAYTFSSNPTEIEVAHEERAAGTTKYSLYKLMRLNFDLVTGFSLAPLQAFSMVGFILAVGSTGVVVFQIFNRLLRGQAAEGMFQSVTEAMQFFLFGVVLFGIGLLGEYIGRIYQEVLRRPRFIVSAVLEDLSAADQTGQPIEVRSNPVVN
jgi:undecaprenyl-phosphate 4-deoxy-4-formamido-L-arabinose transferase